MEITVNGASRTCPEPLTVADLMLSEGLADRPCAVEVNGSLVPKRRHTDHRLAAGDRVEVVTLVGGG